MQNLWRITKRIITGDILLQSDIQMKLKLGLKGNDRSERNEEEDLL